MQKARCDTCKRMVEVTFPLGLCPNGDTARHQSHSIPISALIGGPLARRVANVLGRKKATQ